MIPNLPFVVAVFAAPATDVPTEFWQVTPERKGVNAVNPPRGKDRAVLIIPGLKIHPIRPALATRPERRDYQEIGSELVSRLSKDSDVFAFSYAQIVPLDAIVQSPAMRNAITRIKDAGYKEIVLVGHSAGGVIARRFAESCPESGVTKVVTVAAPQGGSELAQFRVGYSKAQAPFIQSLSPEARAEAGPLKLSDKIEMACVVCKLKRLEADGLVSIGSQWPEDCRKLGIPAVLTPVNHWDAMSTPESVQVIADLVREKLTRWNATEVEKARSVLFRE